MLEIDKVYCMDCLEGMKLLDDECADCIVTDPPYNTGMTNQKSNGRLCNFFNDNLSEESYLNLVEQYIKGCYRILKNNKAIYIYISWKNLAIWLNSMKKIGFNVKNVIVWDKIVHGLNYQNYAHTYELIIFATKGDFFPENKSINDMTKGYYKDIWHIQRDINLETNSGHETIKKIDVVRLPILHSTKEKELVFDGFMGSGTTALVSKQLNRNFIGFEISPEYCKLINKRLSQRTLLEETNNDTTTTNKGIYEEQRESSCERNINKSIDEFKLC